MTLLRLLSILYALAALAVLRSQAEGQTISRVSVDSSGVEGNRGSDDGSISADGRYIAFSSSASNLVSRDWNNAEDVFCYDRLTRTTRRISVDSAGRNGNSHSYWPSMSADGRYVAFHSDATNLVPGDTNDEQDIFVYDIQLGKTVRASVNSAGGQSSGKSTEPHISLDGRYVVFSSRASNLASGDTNGCDDIFIHDLITGITQLMSVGQAASPADQASYGGFISADGRYVAYSSWATNLVPADTNRIHDIFVYDRQTTQTSRVSVDSTGAQANDASLYPVISADGRMVAFWSRATNLVPGDTNGSEDVFVHDRQTGQSSLVSVNSIGVQADNMSYPSAISLNGQYVAFSSDATNLVANDLNGVGDVFIRDLSTGITRLVSLDAGSVQGNAQSYGLCFSADLRHLVFSSNSSNFVPGDSNHSSDVFVIDRIGACPELVAIGSCPGTITLNVGNATANGFVTFMYGPPRVWVNTSPQCLGLVLGVNPPTRATRIRADGSGTAVVTLLAPLGLCTLSLQAVDQASCTPTSVITL